MAAYAVAVIRETRFGDEIKEYLRRIDDTLAPFSGEYRVHGGPYHPLEGAWRTEHTEGDVLLVQGVPEGHSGAEIVRRLP